MRTPNETAQQIINSTGSIDQAIKVAYKILKFTPLKGMKTYYSKVCAILLIEKFKINIWN
jgi:hypothetical protein